MTGSRYVFIVDDNQSDLELALTALEEAGIAGDFETFQGGDAVRRRLAELADGGARLPDAVLLDLNMPGTSGFDVLAAIKGDAALRAIRTLVLTTSNSPLDRRRCQQLHADGFLVKPTGFDELIALLARIFPDAPP